MGIASLVVQIKPDQKEKILSNLEEIQGLEVVQHEDPAAWIILVDIKDEAIFVEILKELQQYPEFISISYASHYTEEAI